MSERDSLTPKSLFFPLLGSAGGKRDPQAGVGGVKRRHTTWPRRQRYSVPKTVSLSGANPNPRQKASRSTRKNLPSTKKKVLQRIFIRIICVVLMCLRRLSLFHSLIWLAASLDGFNRETEAVKGFSSWIARRAEIFTTSSNIPSIHVDRKAIFYPRIAAISSASLFLLTNYFSAFRWS